MSKTPNVLVSITLVRDLKQQERAALLQGRAREANRLREIRRLATEQMYDDRAA